MYRKVMLFKMSPGSSGKISAVAREWIVVFWLSMRTSSSNNTFTEVSVRRKERKNKREANNKLPAIPRHLIRISAHRVQRSDYYYVSSSSSIRDIVKVSSVYQYWICCSGNYKLNNTPEPCSSASWSSSISSERWCGEIIIEETLKLCIVPVL
jgi:hypothetical protein